MFTTPQHMTSQTVIVTTALWEGKKAKKKKKNHSFIYFIFSYTLTGKELDEGNV